MAQASSTRALGAAALMALLEAPQEPYEVTLTHLSRALTLAPVVHERRWRQGVLALDQGPVRAIGRPGGFGALALRGAGSALIFGRGGLRLLDAQGLWRVPEHREAELQAALGGLHALIHLSHQRPGARVLNQDLQQSLVQLAIRPLT